MADGLPAATMDGGSVTGGSASAAPSQSAARQGPSYQVVARRYRPRTFEELVGQQAVAQALRNSILANRVGHAYLFTGARGVGKTSTARIFAKALNCIQGPTPYPDNTCDICRSIDVGEDVDVLEIDGASNRGIEEIRQLRATVHTRPSRARYKIYIIDEVHMLTIQAFNALLKTLEEPPEHVKFIFCTTDPEKIPVTVLSRCQRFDFAPIEPEEIRERLRLIVEREGRQVDDEVLDQLARRAGGSMRDSQSLLEQLLAFGSERITHEELRCLLGTTDYSTLYALAKCALERNTPEMLGTLESVLRRGADAGHVAEQLLTLFRDMLVATTGGGAHLALLADRSAWEELAQTGRRIGLESLMAIVQILDQCLVRMRQSSHARVLLELALLRICSLPDLQDLATILESLKQQEPGGARPESPGAPTTASSGAVSITDRSVATGAARPTAAPVESSSVGVTSSQGRGASAKEQRASIGEATQKKTSDAHHSDAHNEEAATTSTQAVTSTEAVTSARAISSAQPPTFAQPAASAPAVTFGPRDTPGAPATEDSFSRALPDQRSSGDGHSAKSAGDAHDVWQQAASQIGGLAQQMMQMAVDVQWDGPGKLRVLFAPNGLMAMRWCERADRRHLILGKLQEIAGQPISCVFGQAAQSVSEPEQPVVRSPRQHAAQHGLVRAAIEVFDAELVRVEPPRTQSQIVPANAGSDSP